MANIDKISKPILQDAARNLGWQWDNKDEDIMPYLEKMKDMSIEKIFDLYCNWQGLQGWGRFLFGVVEHLQKSEQ